MRHIASLLLGFVIAPIAWILIGAATIGLDPHGLYKDAVGAPANAVAMAMFAAAGLMLGVLAVSRLSPTGPVMAALVFGGLFAFFRFVAEDYSLPSILEAVKIPTDSATAAGRSGLVLAIAALLAVAVLIPSRWRGKDDEADRIVNTSELSKPRNDSQRSTDSVDPFAPAFTDSDRQPPSGTTSFPSVGTGFDERPTDPYGGSRNQTSVPEQRSPYADDAYDGQQGYGQSGGYQNQQPRYGETQQQQFGYGNEQQYR